jgi:hypothetical protein
MDPQEDKLLRKLIRLVLKLACVFSERVIPADMAAAEPAPPTPPPFTIPRVPDPLPPPPDTLPPPDLSDK